MALAGSPPAENGSSGSAPPNRKRATSARPKVSTADPHRSLPASLDAEKGVLASILLSPEVVIDECIQNRLTRDHFSHPAHGIIYEAAREMRDRGLPVDLISLTQHLRDRHQLEAAGGAAALAELVNFVPTGANAAFYIQIVREKYLLRRIILTCNAYAARAYEEQAQVKQLLDEVESGILSIGDEREIAHARSIRELTMEAVAHVESIFSKKGQIHGLSTGFPTLDRMTDGFLPGQMIVIAARPSVGKSALAMNIAEHVAIERGKKVAVFSLEMTTQELVLRLLCSMARVNLRKVHELQQFSAKPEMDRIVQAADRLAKARMFIDDTAGLSILELRARCRRLAQREGGLDLVIVDYLQLVRGSSVSGADHREREVAEISAGLKGLAKELQVPVLAIAQLNRDPEKRNASGKSKPRLSDIRESGSIEQDADLVALLWRENYQDHDAEEKKEGGEAVGLTELIIAKQRNGPTGEVHLVFLQDYMRFEERAARGLER